MASRYGRRRAARACHRRAPRHWRTATFVAGLCESGIIAPLVLDGPITGPAFRAYVEQFLAPVPRARCCRGARQSRRTQGR